MRFALSLALAISVASPLVAQEKKKRDKQKGDKRDRASASLNWIFQPKGITFTAEQQEKNVLWAIGCCRASKRPVHL